MAQDHAFLTDRRQEILADYDSNNSAHRALKSRARSGAATALEELVWVAECDEIDNSDVFDAPTVRAFLEALLGDNEKIKPCWEAWNESDEAIREHEQTYRYERRLIQSISTVTTLYEDRLLAQRKPRYLENTSPGADGGIIEDTSE